MSSRGRSRDPRPLKGFKCLVDDASEAAFEFSKSSLGQGSSAFDGVPVLGAVKVVQPWGAPS